MRKPLDKVGGDVREGCRGWGGGVGGGGGGSLMLDLDGNVLPCEWSEICFVLRCMVQFVDVFLLVVFCFNFLAQQGLKSTSTVCPCLLVCLVCVCAVSYTHLTLPTSGRV